MHQRHLDSGLSELSKQLLTMAGHVEQAIEAATQALRQKSHAKIESIYAIEQKVNQAHIEVDELCVKLLALQQPMAADLRFIVSIIKINTDLERMVDLTVNIGNNLEYFLEGQPRFSLADLDAMADQVRVMVREVLNAFVKQDEQTARNVLLRDDDVDAYKRKIVDDAVAAMQKDVACVRQGLNLILMAKNLERIGDHATNIAEDIIYMASGEDIRHSAGGPGVKSK